jgi:adenylate cyclase
MIVVAWGAASIATRVTASIPQRLRDTAAVPRTVTGTVCFVDIAAFTRTGERCDPARLASELDCCLATLTRIVESHGGFVDKYLGDGLMALFGCDKRDAGGRAAFGAVRACLREHLALGGERVRLRVGMACGALRVGAIGDSRRLRITAIGDTVNVAARLEQLNRELDTTILADEAVAAANQDAEWIDHGERRLRGRALPVRVWSAGIIEPSCASPCPSSRLRYSPLARWSLIRQRAP